MLVDQEAADVEAFLATPPVRHDPADRCRCTYHQWLRQPAYEGPTPDDHLED